MRGWRRRDGFTQDIRVEMSWLPLLQRQEFRDPTVLAPQSVVDFAVCDNAETLERPGRRRTGRTVPGRETDLVMLDYDPVVLLMPENALWHYELGFPGACDTRRPGQR